MCMTFYVQNNLRLASRQSWGRLFGTCIEKTRKACGHSLEEAARLSGMETSEWAAVEAGCVPDPAQLHPMSDALGLRHDKIATLAFICQGAWEV
jgi:transcriptional regulator GlxA family with amidase domain